MQRSKKDSWYFKIIANPVAWATGDKGLRQRTESDIFRDESSPVFWKKAKTGTVFTKNGEKVLTEC